MPATDVLQERQFGQRRSISPDDTVEELRDLRHNTKKLLEKPGELVRSPPRPRG